MFCLSFEKVGITTKRQSNAMHAHLAFKSLNSYAESIKLPIIFGCFFHEQPQGDYLLSLDYPLI
jgi:hypothetical protein